MKSRFACLLLVLLAAASPAMAQDVRYNFDSQADFASFKTYKWVTIKGATPLSDLADKQIKAAVDAELAKKGLTKTDADTADLYIGYQAGVGKEKEYTSFDTGWGYGPGWYGGGWYGGGGGPRHVLVEASHARLAREREQDARHRGEARETAEEPRESRREDAQELPAQGEEVTTFGPICWPFGSGISRTAL